jgi:hypothetical protein
MRREDIRICCDISRKIPKKIADHRISSEAMTRLSQLEWLAISASLRTRFIAPLS